MTGADLILVGPLGFSVTDRWLKRSGLDYWEGVNVTIIDDLEAYLDKTDSPFYFFSSKATQRYSDVKYTQDAILIFGSETSGLPQHYAEKWPEKFATIPMNEGARCLNLASSAAIVLYEAFRQNNFQF